MSLMGYEEADIKEMLYAVDRALAYANTMNRVSTVPGLTKTQELLEGLLEEGRV